MLDPLLSTLVRTKEAKPLTWWVKASYAIGGCGYSVFERIRAYYTSPFLLDEVGMSATMVGLILLVSRLWDAVNDPLIGELSDTTVSARFGRRRSWLLYSALPLAATYLLLWWVPPLGSTLTIVYFWLLFLAFEVFASAARIPHSALMPELTTDYHEVTSLSQWRYFVATAVGMGASSLQAIMMEWFDDESDAYIVSGLFWAAFCIPTLLIAVFFAVEPADVVEQRKRPLRRMLTDVEVHADNVVVRTLKGLWTSGKYALSNRSFVTLVVCFCSSSALEFVATNQVYYIEYVLDASPRIMAESLLIQTAGRLLSIPVWAHLSFRFGKKNTLLAGLGMLALFQAGFFFLGEGDEDIFLIMTPIRGALGTCHVLLTFSMVADVVDEDELLTGKRREGLYYSFSLFLQKVVGSAAVGVSSLALGVVGYQTPPDDSGENTFEQKEAVIFALNVMSTLLPAAIFAVGWIACLLYPITPEVHQRIKRELETERGITN